MKTLQAFVVDAVAVLVFALIGRSSHDEANTALGVAGTAWPFLAGLVVGHLADRVRRSVRKTPQTVGPASVGTGVTVWAGTVVAGLLFRVTAAGATAQPAFVVVASISLAVLLLGWRFGLAAIRRTRRARTAA